MTPINPKARSKFSSYYGGDKIQEDDEESKKLYLSDCHRKQAALYPAFAFKSSSVRSLLHTPNPGELLVYSGQSRLHLHLRQDQLASSHNCGRYAHFPTIDESEPVFPQFPSTLEDECSIFRAHGFPLLVWPASQDIREIQQYLDVNFPDCAQWFTEFHKVMAWLKHKWRPLSQAIGGVQTSTSTESATVWLRELPSDSVAFTYTTKRLQFYEEYASLLATYFAHRRQFTRGFHFHTIHAQLRKMYEDRQSNLVDDSGFFNVVGDRLLRLSVEAQSNSAPIRINAKAIAQSVTDSALRTNCLHTLLSVKALNAILKRKGDKRNSESIQKKALTEHNEDSYSSSDESTGVMEDEPQAPVITEPGVHPNRPATKEIIENRGLVKYRHKRERNPRVHLRHKYRKATIRYRSRVPPARFEEKPYAGEAKGIRVHLVKSHKFKRS